jgi:hypothetical protein
MMRRTSRLLAPSTPGPVPPFLPTTAPVVASSREQDAKRHIALMLRSARLAQHAVLQQRSPGLASACCDDNYRLSLISGAAAASDP